MHSFHKKNKVVLSVLDGIAIVNFEDLNNIHNEIYHIDE